MGVSYFDELGAALHHFLGDDERQRRRVEVQLQGRAHRQRNNLVGTVEIEPAFANAAAEAEAAFVDEQMVQPRAFLL